MDLAGLTKHLKRLGFSSSRRRTHIEYYRQRQAEPFVVDWITVQLGANRRSEEAEWFFIAQSTCIGVEMIFLGQVNSHTGVSPLLMISAERVEEDTLPAWKQGERGFSADLAPDVLWDRAIEPALRWFLPATDILNRLLFIDVVSNRDRLYGSNAYPRGRPDPARGNYKDHRAQDRHLIFLLFYFLGDGENAAFWLDEQFQRPSFPDSDFRRWLDSWALTAREELARGVYRSIKMPGWATVDWVGSSAALLGAH